MGEEVLAEVNGEDSQIEGVITKLPEKFFRALMEEEIEVGKEDNKRAVDSFYFRAKNQEHAEEQAGLVAHRFLTTKIEKVIKVREKDIPDHAIYIPTLNERVAKMVIEKFGSLKDRR